MTAYEIIRLIGTEFSGVSDADVEQWIEFTRPMVSRKQFGKLYEQALALLVCHRMKMSGLGDDDGLGSVAVGLRVGSVSEGETSVSFGGGLVGMAGRDGEYALTTYGVQWLNLRRMVIVPIHSAGELR